MPPIDVDGLRFRFPEGWHTGKYDEWPFYRNRWSRMWDGIKAVDIVAIGPDQTGWLIEVKDYSKHPRTKPIDLGTEIARKVFDTLAALIPARVNAAEDAEQRIAAAMTEAHALRIVLHLEQPATFSRLRPRMINPADVLQKLKQILKPIDPHTIVTDRERMGGLPWNVTRL